MNRVKDCYYISGITEIQYTAIIHYNSNLNNLYSNIIPVS